MPTGDFDGGFGTLFYCINGGKRVPIASVEEIRLPLTEENETYVNIWGQQDGVLEFKMTAQSSRRLKKQLRHVTNGISRRIRTIKRQREKARRAWLKGVME